MTSELEYLLAMAKSKTATNTFIGIGSGIVSFLLQDQKGWKMFLKMIVISIFTATVLAPAIIKILSQGLGIAILSAEIENSLVGLIAISSYQLLPAIQTKLVKIAKDEKK